ncbi:unnamed protein product [Staurois parvus]|uniref:Uncharacterized protein n=1 Tax=Staurois parvus TaxID=386267 RepID=A0ABN9EYT3_9NEOB|nr:unnamed protein product [Staurois parvus]
MTRDCEPLGREGGCGHPAVTARCPLRIRRRTIHKAQHISRMRSGHLAVTAGCPH